MATPDTAVQAIVTHPADVLLDKRIRSLPGLTRNERDVAIHLASLADADMLVRTTYREVARYLTWVSPDSYKRACRGLVEKGVLTRIRSGNAKVPTIWALSIPDSMSGQE